MRGGMPFAKIFLWDGFVFFIDRDYLLDFRKQ